MKKGNKSELESKSQSQSETYCKLEDDKAEINKEVSSQTS